MFRFALFASNRAAQRSARFYGDRIINTVKEAAESEVCQQLVKAEPVLTQKAEPLLLWKAPSLNPEPRPYASDKVKRVLARTPEEAAELVDSIMETQRSCNSYY